MINTAVITEIAGVIKSIAEVGTAVMAVTDAIGLTDTSKPKPIDTKTYSQIDNIANGVCGVCDAVSNLVEHGNSCDRAFRYINSIQSK